MEEEQSVWVSEEQRRICKELAEHYRAIISLLGDDPDREGLRKTPERTAKAMMQLTRGYRQSAQEIISSAVFEHTGSRIVVVRDIEFYSFCEHHLLPFFGKVFPVFSRRFISFPVRSPRSPRRRPFFSRRHLPSARLSILAQPLS